MWDFVMCNRFFSTILKCWLPIFDVIGESVVAAGYPLSTESLVTHNRTPMLSKGCVAKISERGGPLQTTCCTQSGLSGGALLRHPDQLLGIIVSNVRLDSMTMSSFSFAVSVEDFKRPVTKYIETKGITLLLNNICVFHCHALVISIFPHFFLTH